MTEEATMLPPRVPIIGLVGGIASGKTKVAHLLRGKGALLIDADRIGHSVLDREDTRSALIRAFGRQILDDNGVVHRPTLGNMVFGSDAVSTENRRRLEAIVHPQIKAEAMAMIQRAQASASPPPAIVLDAPLLIEAGWNQWCDQILYIEASPITRLKRALLRGWTEEQFQQRERAQTSVAQKKSYATSIILNDSDANDDLKQQVDAWWSRLDQPRLH